MEKKDGRYDIICSEQRLRESGRESLVTLHRIMIMQWKFYQWEMTCCKILGENAAFFFFIGDDGTWTARPVPSSIGFLSV